MLYIKLFIEREKIQVNLRRSVPLTHRRNFFTTWYYCSSRLFRLTNNMSRAVYQRRTVTCLATLTEFDCTVVLQQKCDNATLIIFISTATTTIICVLLLLPSYSDNLHDNYVSWCVCLVICLYLEIKTRVGFSTNGRIFLKRIHFFLPLNVSNHFLHLLHRRLIDRNVY